ncbi:MAG: GTPase Era [Hydrotalea flava]|uniref:GTPase Era n=1 Tax=Hydrotalea TaxID=1004300 RepID=UPI0016B058E8|nr:MULTISPECIES: GTPase Era [Hydrotalea]NIM35782.1 GTPase Era [Hydrotalea flava]NIM38632.1 GTPase Era [Hydrotalea flava]NIN03816.1 GTPase Era [Hydrotalea flava]NIN15510.1 GTPase Era [Hydrotalea flava]NIO94558.1 GTPase Era [Hydrotalea flava]
MKAGFVGIFGKPNAGKSTLLNALLGEKLAIVSSKVQTTRHRIKGFLSKPGEYQIVFSDTPGIIEAKYKLHEKMMGAVKSALEDTDVAILLADVTDDLESCDALFQSLHLKVPVIVVLNKKDKVGKEVLQNAIHFFESKPYAKKVLAIAALQQQKTDELVNSIVEFLPEGEPFYPEDELSDLPTRFFVSELIREKIYTLFEEEIPYHVAVLVNEFKEKEHLIKIQADIIVNRDTQKSIIIGHQGNKIKEIGTLARKDIEAFLGGKVFLELFVKVRPKWRDNDLFLKEFGYH